MVVLKRAELRLHKDRGAESPRDPLARLGSRSHFSDVRAITASRRAMLGLKPVCLQEDAHDWLLRYPDVQRLSRSQRELLLERLGGDIENADRIAQEVSVIRAAGEFSRYMKD